MPNLFFIKDIKKSNSSCDFYDGEKKYIATADLQDGKIVNYELVAFNNKPSRANLIAEKGSVIFAKMQNTIKVLEINESNMDNIYSTGFYSFKDERIIPSYLKFFFESDVFNIIKDKNCQGATMKAINDEGMSKISINVPTIQKQQKIITELSKITDLININRKNLFNLDIIVKSQFIEMFDKYDRIELYKIANIIMGQSPDSKSYNDEKNGLPFYQGKADYGEKYTITRHWTSMPTKIAKKGDVLMSVRAPVGPLNIASCDCCIGRGLCSINSNTNYTNNEFIYCALNAIQDHIASLGTGSTFKAINKLDIYNLLLPNAPIELQNKFADFVQQIDKSKYMLLEILVIAIIQTES